MPGLNLHHAFILVGPTAAGKTAVAQRLAECRQADILSADSMLVYRGMDIGTAKPSLAERKGIRYWGVDVAEPSQAFNVACYLEEARRCFEASEKTGRPVIVVGGTGLYIRALLEGIDQLPAIPAGSRARWQAVFDQDGVAGLQSALKSRNPLWLSGMADPANSRRLIRALELVEAGCAGPPASWAAGKPAAVIAGLDVDPDALRSRIECRVRTMYEEGLLNEVQALLDGVWDPSGTAAQAIGYAEAIACLKGTLTQEAAMEETSRRTRQLAKRQRTWFRHQLNLSWVPVADGLSLDEIAGQVSSVWDQTGPQCVAV